MNSGSKNLKILLIEDNPGDARLIKEMLKEAGDGCEIKCVERLSTGIEYIEANGFDVILLDLGLPDSQGLNTLTKLNEIKPEAPVIILTGLDDETVGEEAVKEGAQDYLVKGQIDKNYLMRSIRYAIERNRAEKESLKKEEFILNILETVDEGFIVIDRDYRVIGANRAFREQTGLSPAEIIGQHCFKMSHHCDMPCYEEGEICAVKQVFETGKSHTVIHTHHDAQGMPIHVETKAYPLSKDSSGSVITAIEILVDITEKKKAEEMIRAASKDWTESFDAINDMITIHDADFNIIRANKAAASGLGLAMQDILTNKCFKSYHGRDCPPEGCPSCITLKTGVASTTELFEPHLNKFVEIKALPRFDADNNVIGLVHVVRDITERKQAEDELRKSEAEFRLLADAMPQIVWVTRPDGWNTYFNQQWVEYTGQTLEDSYGDGWNKPFHPDDQQRAWDAWQNATKNGSTYSVECRLRRADGVYKWWLVRGVPVLDEHGSVIKWFGTCTDIDDMKRAADAHQKSEERFRQIAESAEEWIWEVNRDGLYTYSSPIVEVILGYKSEEIVGKKYFYDFFSPNMREQMKKEAFEVFAAKRAFTKYVNSNVHKNSNVIILETTGVPILDSRGDLLGYRGVNVDVTEHLKLEDQLRHAQKMEAVGTLAGGIAHDFNNILNVIIGYGNMLMDKLKPDSTEKEQMNEVLNAAERAAALTKRLLVFSRKQLVEVKHVNINELILGLQKMLGRIIRESIDFKLALADRPLIVLADAGQIEQVLMNLASNAKDSMLEGGLLTIGTGFQELDEEYVAAYGYGKPGKYALITFADTGQGMDEETKKKIFEPFFTTKGIGEGTGLGLAISYGIIKQHDGYIKVYSEVGKGTEFKIYLPLIEETAALEKKIEPPVFVKGGNETILVAEDDASLRKLTRIVLESHGYNIITADDGEDAITKFMENRENISLAVIDMIMPKKSGKEVGEAIRKVSPGTKILFASGYTMDIIKGRELTEAGFDFIFKPVLPKDLLKKVREILDREPLKSANP